jgi:hypothetical protein
LLSCHRRGVGGQLENLDPAFILGREAGAQTAAPEARNSLGKRNPPLLRLANRRPRELILRFQNRFRRISLSNFAGERHL